MNIEEMVAAADKKMETEEVQNEIKNLEQQIASFKAQLEALDAEISPLEADISNLTKELEQSANYIGNLTSQLNNYLSTNQANLSDKERSSLQKLVYQSYTTSVYLSNGSIPQKLSNQEFQLFAVIHYKATSLHANLNWDQFQDRKAILDADESWANATSFNTNVSLLIKNDILQEGTTQKEAISKFNGYRRVADLLLEQGCQDGAVAVQAGISGPVSLIVSRNYADGMSNQKLANLSTQDSYRNAHTNDVKEGITGMPFAGMYKTDREFIVAGSQDKSAAIKNLALKAQEPIEKQKRLKAAVDRTGVITAPDSSPLGKPTSELENVDDLYERSKSLFPKKT